MHTTQILKCCSRIFISNYFQKWNIMDLTSEFLPLLSLQIKFSMHMHAHTHTHTYHLRHYGKGLYTLKLNLNRAYTMHIIPHTQPISFIQFFKICIRIMWHDKTDFPKLWTVQAYQKDLTSERKYNKHNHGCIR